MGIIYSAKNICNSHIKCLAITAFVRIKVVNLSTDSKFLSSSSEYAHRDNNMAPGDSIVTWSICVNLVIGSICSKIGIICLNIAIYLFFW